jgi:protoheme IX farnesyltransferase
MTGSITSFLSVFKLRIGFAIALTALAGMAAAQGPAPEAWRIALLALAVLLSGAGAGAFNQFHEAALDRLMKRTRGRPFASGVYEPNRFWLAGILLLIGASTALAAFAANSVAALYVFLGAFVYGFVYTVWLKRRSTMNIVVGGLAGSFAVLAGAAAVDPHLNDQALILALVLFLWTPPHFWALALALKEDYRAAGVPMLSVVLPEHRAARLILLHTITLVMASLLPWWFGAGPAYMAGAILGGAFFIYKSLLLWRNPSQAAARRAFHASLFQLVGVLAGVMLDAAMR